MKFILQLVLLITCFLIPVFAQQTVTISPSKDNTLYETTDGSSSNGAGSYLFVGQVGSSGGNKNRRTVIKFDLTGKLPANAVITGAKLKMNMSKTSAGSSIVKVYRLIADWGEGTSDAGANEGSGASSTANDATWIHRFFSTQNWLSPGGDYVPVASASLAVSGNGSYTWEDTLMRGDVISWNAAPSSNFGWIMIGNESGQSAKRFDSRTSTTTASRPQLIITYTIASSVRNDAAIIGLFELRQNYPNPFNPVTSISFSLPQGGFTSVKVFDLLGNEVKMLVNEYLGVGAHSVTFDGNNLSSGIYLYRIQSGIHTATKKLVLLK